MTVIPFDSNRKKSNDIDNDCRILAEEDHFQCFVTYKDFIKSYKMGSFEDISEVINGKIVYKEDCSYTFKPNDDDLKSFKSLLINSQVAQKIEINQLIVHVYPPTFGDRIKEKLMSYFFLSKCFKKR